MNPNRRASRTDDLILVAQVESFHDPLEPPLNIGNKVRLNSGGPEMLVVEIDGDNVTAGYNSSGELADTPFPPFAFIASRSDASLLRLSLCGHVAVSLQLPRSRAPISPTERLSGPQTFERRIRDDLLGHHLESRQLCRTEAGRSRDVRSISSSRNNNLSA
jgi:hypothetical protein